MLKCTCAYCEFDRRMHDQLNAGLRPRGYTFCEELPTPKEFATPMEFALFMDDLTTISMEDYANTWH